VRLSSYQARGLEDADRNHRDNVSGIAGMVRSLQLTNERFEIKTQENFTALSRDLVQAITKTAKVVRNDQQSVAKLQDYIERQIKNDDGIHHSEATRISNELQSLSLIVNRFTRAAQTAQQDQVLLKALYFSNIRSRIRKVEKSHEDTFTWIFKDSSVDRKGRPVRFAKWLRNENGVFWIQGKPGSGKSTLMKYLCGAKETNQHLASWAAKKRLVIASFFFWNSGTQLQKSQEGLFRSLLYEMLCKAPELIPIAREAAAASDDDPGELVADSWDLETLMRVYESLVTQTVLPVKFFFFIDGLDEFQDENRTHADLLKALRDMRHSQDVKFCVSSRPWAVFGDEFNTNPERVLKLEDLTEGDIFRYVTDKFNEHPQFPTLRGLDAAYQDLINTVVTRAQGVFLWVYLVVRTLLEGLTYHDSVRTLRTRLEAFPPDLEAFFQHLIDSVPDIYRVQLARSFYIAAAAGEPVLAMFYSFIDDVEENEEFATTLSENVLTTYEVRLRLEQLRRRLDGRSRGLLEIVGDLGERKSNNSYNNPDKGEQVDEHVDDYRFLSPKVDFLHRTVRDFIYDSPEVKSLIDQALNPKTDVLLHGCHAALALIKVVPFHTTDHEWMFYIIDILFFFASEARNAGASPEVVGALLHKAEETYRAADRSHHNRLCATSLSISHVFSGLAARTDMAEYLENRWFHTTGFGGARPLLDYALSPPSTQQPLPLRTIKLLLGHGARPNRVYGCCNIWAHFVATLPVQVKINHDAAFEVTAALVRAGADIHSSEQPDSSTSEHRARKRDRPSRFPITPYQSYSSGGGELYNSGTVEKILRTTFTPAEFELLEGFQAEAKANKPETESRLRAKSASETKVVSSRPAQDPDATTRVETPATARPQHIATAQHTPAVVRQAGPDLEVTVPVPEIPATASRQAPCGTSTHSSTPPDGGQTVQSTPNSGRGEVIPTRKSKRKSKWKGWLNRLFEKS
jgi:hypothetical protein